MANWNDLFGGGPVRLAPDLTYPSSKSSATSNFSSDTNIAVVGGALSTVKSLTGKYAISYLNASNLLSESMTWKLTVDGVVVWNSVGSGAGTELLLGSLNNSANISEVIGCNSSFLLEVTTTSDTLIDLDYLARKTI